MLKMVLYLKDLKLQKIQKGRGMKTQKSTEDYSTKQQDNLKTQTQMEKFYAALRKLEKVNTPLDEAVDKA